MYRGVCIYIAMQGPTHQLTFSGAAFDQTQSLFLMVPTESTKREARQEVTHISSRASEEAATSMSANAGQWAHALATGNYW